MERKSFVLYQSYEEQINCLQPAERGLLFSAIFEYLRTGEISEPLPFGANIIFIGIRDGLNRDLEKYEKMCERNKENAKKAGRPKKIHSISEKSYNDNDNENENDNDNDNDNVGENDNENGNETTAPKSAPLSASAPQTEKEKREAEKRILIAAGVPLEYIDEREKRGAEFSKKQKKSFIDVFMEWWDKDKASFERKREFESVNGNGALHSKEKSYDTDAFFEAALKKSYDEFEKRYGTGDAQGDFFEKKSP